MMLMMPHTHLANIVTTTSTKTMMIIIWMITVMTMITATATVTIIVTEMRAASTTPMETRKRVVPLP